MATLPADRGHNDRRMEGIRQCNMQVAAAQSGSPIPSIDTSLLSQDSFFPDLSQRAPPMSPMERYLAVDMHQEPTVVYTRTATSRELEELRRRSYASSRSSSSSSSLQ